MEFAAFLHARHPDVPLPAADAVLRLVAEGATLPFIARYRKEQTGNLDEVRIQAVIEAREDWDALLARQDFVVREIERQGKLTPELRERILATFDREALEDLYLPYKRKRTTRAMVARDAGLEPLADWIWNCGHGLETPQPGQTLELWAFTFRNEEKGFADAEAAIQGAEDILVERLAENLALRQLVREETFTKGWLRTTKGEKAQANSKFDRYFDHAEPVTALLEPHASHRYLAIRRGVAEGELDMRLGGGPQDPEFDDRLQREFETVAWSVPDSPAADVLARAARRAFVDHVAPGVATAVHKAMKTVADDVAIAVFAENVRKLLLAAPFGPKAVLGVDPGIRTGCKLAVVDDAGTFVTSGVLKLKTDEGKENAKGILGELVPAQRVQAVAIGNGTAGRETERFVRTALGERGLSVPVVMVSEAGASVYSASEVARKEFPDLDVTVRGAISIARRLQDPLAELVKIDPKSIGVGQYQHDVAPHLLKRSLERVVESCVNQVGVALNTASEHLLAHVAGIGEALAASLVAYRSAHGLFRTRAQLLEVPHFTRKTFEQAAGFLRIAGGDHPLDNTAVHPERYEALERFATGAGVELTALLDGGAARVRESSELRAELGEFTFADVCAELARPGRDPRETFVPFQFRDDVHTLDDLKPGLTCPGIVTNVTNFGAFVDIGVHQDGLVHISRLSDTFVKDPRDVVSPGDRVQVRVVEVNKEKGQIALSMKPPRAHAERGRREQRADAGGPPRPRRHGPPSPDRDGAPRPRHERRGGPRPDGHGGPPGPRPERRPRPPRDDRPPRPERSTPQPAFNNPFASLKDRFKPGG